MNGCFQGSLSEFKKEVSEKHAEGTEHRLAYDKLIALIETIIQSEV